MSVEEESGIANAEWCHDESAQRLLHFTPLWVWKFNYTHTLYYIIHRVLYSATVMCTLGFSLHVVHVI